MKTGLPFIIAAALILAAAGGTYVYLLGDEPVAAPAAVEKAARQRAELLAAIRAGDTPQAQAAE